MHHTPRLRLVIFPGFLEKAFTFEPVSNDFGNHLISSKCIATDSFGYKGIPGLCGIYGDMTGRKVLKRGRLREVKRKKEHEKREEAFERSSPAKTRLKGEGVR